MKRLIGRAACVAVAGLLFAGAQAFAAHEPEAVPGEYIVRLKSSVSLKRSNIASVQQQLGTYVKSVLPDQNIVVVKRPVFELKSNVINTLAQNPLVEVVEPNFIYRANVVPNDPMLGQLWGMKNVGQPDSAKQTGVEGMDIGAEDAWDVTTGSKDVVVAVIDTGILYNNPDLVSNVWTNEAELNGKAGVDDDNNGYVDDIHGYNFVANSGDPLDDHGHGSHCSGTIGGSGNDGKGIVGVAWNVRIMGVKFLDKDGSGTLENALKAIDYATKNGAKIMSNSWGGGGFSDTLKAAIQRANDAGALFVAAAGNDGNDNDANPTYPGSYDVPNVLAVAAIDNRGKMASFSSYGKKSVHVGAPGVNIVSTTTAGYESWSGTSMATPHVTGIATLVLSHEPTLTNLEIKERIIATAKPIASLRGKVQSGGLANAYNAVTNSTPPPDPNDPAKWATVPVSVSSAHPYKDKTNQTFEVNVPGAKQVSLYFDKFDTEGDYDLVTLFNAKGEKIDTMSGSNNDTFSAIVDGDYVKIVFTSDDSVSRYGFDITKAAWR